MPTQQAAPRPAASSARPLRPGRGIARLILPVLVLSLIGLGAVVVIALWWRSTPRPTDTGALLTAAGDVLGLLAGYGFVVLVALMARLPPLEKGIGTDRLARWHAMGGRYVITLVSGHVPLIVWGYAVSAHVKVTSEAATLLTTYPDVLMATVAWFLLLGVAAFSARAARRRLKYETWYYAHLYTYLAIALAFSHQFADGPAFRSDYTARVAWSALYATVGALIVWYRVVTPLLSAARHQFTVQYVRPEAPGIVSVFITGRNLDRLRAEPGQFFRWRFLTRELWWQSHPYSLSAMPSPNQMRITVKDNGDHSGSLAGLAPGTRVFAEGPYGAFTPVAHRPAGAVHRRRGRHHPDPGDVRRAAEADVGRHHPPLPGQPSSGRRLQPRTERDRDRPAGRPALPDRLPRRARLRPPRNREPAAGHPRAAPVRGLRVRAARHDPDSGDRAARRGHTVAPHPPRVLRLLTPPHPP